MRWPIYCRRVDGVSLMPAIAPGKMIIFWGWRRPGIGQLVLAQVDDQEVIKQIKAIEGDKYSLVGLLAGATSYRVAQTAILGVAVGYNNLHESTRRPTG